MKYYSLIFLILLLSCANNKSNSENKKASVDPSKNETAGSESFQSIFKKNVVTELNNSIDYIFQNSNGDFWFSSHNNGVYFYYENTLFHFTTEDGLADNQVFSIQEDFQKNIWFNTANGICRFNGLIFHTPSLIDQLILNTSLVTPLESNDIWFAHGGGAFRYSNGSFSYLLLENKNSEHINTTKPESPQGKFLSEFSVYCLLKDSKNNVWLGTQTLGVCKYDGKKMEWFSEKGLEGPAVRAIFEDSKGNLWFGNNGNGLFKYDGNILRNITEEYQLGNKDFPITGKGKEGTMARVWTVNEDKDGNILIGTIDAGIWMYNDKNLENYTTADGLLSNTILFIFKDNKNEFWIGTAAGINKFDGKTFSKFEP